MSRDPVDRREALRAGLSGLAAVVLAPGLFLIAGRGEARPTGVAASPAQRWGLLVDVSRCADGCSHCVDACRAEHGWSGDGADADDTPWIRTVTATDGETGRTVRLPLMCQHCARPPCADVCPTGATFRRADGVVLVDRHICIGCRYCVMACPFNVRFFVGEEVRDQRPHMPRGKGTAEGCTLCVHRIDDGRQPACVEACAGAGGAMLFGDVNDPAGPIGAALARHPTTRLRPDLALAQGVRYQGL
jgi:molybdopterin-containing oxidoreductase family iron-sulfur binding subunit